MLDEHWSASTNCVEIIINNDKYVHGRNRRRNRAMEARFSVGAPLLDLDTVFFFFFFFFSFFFLVAWLENGSLWKVLQMMDEIFHQRLRYLAYCCFWCQLESVCSLSIWYHALEIQYLVAIFIYYCLTLAYYVVSNGIQRPLHWCQGRCQYITHQWQSLLL